MTVSEIDRFDLIQEQNWTQYVGLVREKTRS